MTLPSSNRSVKGVTTPLTYASTGSTDLVRQFFDALYGEMPKELYIVFWRKDSKQSEFIALSDLDFITSKYLEDRLVPDLYFGLGLHSEPSNKINSRGLAMDVVAIPGLWFDIDCINGSHKQTKLPTVKEARAFVRELPFGQPSITVDSGGGYHIYWLFREPWIIENQTEWELAAKLSYDVQFTVKTLGAKYGWEFDITADLSRVLRVPNSLNTKQIPHKNVKIINLDPNSRYNPSDFEPWLLESNISDKKFHHISPTKSLYRKSDVDFTSIINGCNWLKHCRNDAKELSEPEWFAMLSVIAKCSDGLELAHELSKPYPKYCKVETDRKYQHAGSLMYPYSCKKINLLTAGKYCTACSYNKKIRNPIDIIVQESLQEELDQLAILLNNKFGG